MARRVAAAGAPGRARAPRRSPARIAILGHVARPAVRRAASRLVERLERLGADARLVVPGVPGRDAGAGSVEKLARWCELMIALGGDGTALRGARAMAGRRGRLLAVNLGGLGFLTAAESRELGPAVDAALSGRWPVAPRRLIGATVSRRGRRIQRGLAMNDVVIKTAGGYAALHLRLAALGGDLGHVVADGLIAATAAGSTAYSLSAGGPVLSPDAEAMVVTPVCPHTLGSRSLVLAPRDVVSVGVIGSFDRALLLYDGQETVELDAGDTIEIALARTTVRMIQNPGHPFARALQGKLGWQGSPERSMG